MTEETIADLARLRALAEEGRRTPLLGGRHMVLWGVAIMTAALLHWGVLMRALPWPMISLAFIWFGLVGAAGLLSGSGFMLPAKHRESHDLGNRFERIIWQFGGLFLGIVAASLFLAAMIAQHQTGSSERFDLFALMAPITFGVYAIALRATAEVAAQHALKPYALASLFFVAITTMLAGSHWQMPAFALGVFIVTILPGRLMLAGERTHAQASGNG